MSFILHTKFLDFPTISLITAYTAVAVCRAIESVSKEWTAIKWVNDILLNDKKVGGILTEAITDFESGSIDWIVVGIGLNVNTVEEDFPIQLRQIAGSIYAEKLSGAMRNRLAAEIINRILSIDAYDREVFNEYKKRLTMLGSKISITHLGDTYEATAIDVDANGHLIVKKDNGITIALSSGEVSTKIYNQ